MAADELARALEFDRRVALRAGDSSFAIPEGWVVLDSRRPNVHTVNMAILAAPLPERIDAAALVALADRWLGHLDHRFVRVDDPGAGERLAPALIGAGWQRSRTLFMVMRGDGPRATVDDRRAREISEAEMEAVMLANYSEADYGLDATPGLAVQLVDAQTATRVGTTARCFGAGEDGALQSMCTLFFDADVGGTRMAMVESVGTLGAYRERGLATAVVSAAVAAADAWGAELITVPADADDWPQLLYSKLGFEQVGSQVSFTLRRAAARGGA